MLVQGQHSKKRSDMTLASARFLMVLTSLPADKAAAAEALAAYRLRWQVELAFKRLKSGRRNTRPKQTEGREPAADDANGAASGISRPGGQPLFRLAGMRGMGQRRL